MANVMITYRLRAGVDRAAFETWVRDYDYPNIRGVRRVTAFTNHRVERLLIGEGAPSVDYVEVFDLDDLDGFIAEDLTGPVIQTVMGAFMAWVEEPQ
ncbi:MAG TPA: hypothetical protein PLO65_14640, partial [Caulobacter sp.]|nr:hypothetical protein [Caulobacter sp.]